MRSLIRVACIVSSVIIAANCGGGSKSPSSPSSVQPPPPAATTRVIGVSGSLAFGDVIVGSSRDASITITNAGNAPLTVSGLSVSGGFASQSSASWTSGQIAAGGSQPVNIRFSPTAAGTYSGTLTVNADQTSGSNTVAISGTAIASSSFSGTWSGSYVVERCDGTGSVQDILCSANRGAYPVGTVLPISMSLSQTGSSVTGTVSFGSVTGVVTGSVDGGGGLTLRGTATSGSLSLVITSWSTRIQGTSMQGNVSYNATAVGVPGVAGVTVRLSNVSKR